MKRRKTVRFNAALISVLCLIFTAGLLTASMLAISQTGTFSVATHVELQRSMLIAEGVGNRIQYLLAADRNLHPDDKPGEIDYTAYEYDRFLADGILHTMSYYGDEVSFTITDGVAGWDINESTYESVLKNIAEQDDAGDDITELLDQVSHRIGDYLDNDDDIRDYGQEYPGYEDAGAKPLPRNEPLQFREELLYIEDFVELFPLDENGRLSSIRLIPPDGTAALSGVPSLFSASRQDIDLQCDLSDEELDTVMYGLERWKNEKELLSDNIDEEILNKLKSKFSTSESGVYTVMINSPSNNPGVFRKLIFTYAGFEVDGPAEQNVDFMEWNFL